MVEAYRDARWADEARREAATFGYRAEELEYASRMVTFKRWLTSGGWDAFRLHAAPVDSR